jgi:hypothetical protein
MSYTTRSRDAIAANSAQPKSTVDWYVYINAQSRKYDKNRRVMRILRVKPYTGFPDYRAGA